MNPTTTTISIPTTRRYADQIVEEGRLGSRQSEHVAVFGGRRYGLGISDGTVINQGPGMPRRPLLAPEAYAFALSTCLDNYGGTGAEAARNRAAGIEHDVALGDVLVFDGADAFEVVAPRRYVDEGFRLVLVAR
jgi:hypothetical protein